MQKLAKAQWINLGKENIWFSILADKGKITRFGLEVWSLPEIYRDYPCDPLLFSVARGIFWLSTERLSRSTLHLKEGWEGSLYSEVKKSPKVGPLLIFSISLVLANVALRSRVAISHVAISHAVSWFRSNRFQKQQEQVSYLSDFYFACSLHNAYFYTYFLDTQNHSKGVIYIIITYIRRSREYLMIYRGPGLIFLAPCPNPAPSPVSKLSPKCQICLTDVSVWKFIIVADLPPWVKWGLKEYIYEIGPSLVG